MFKNLLILIKTKNAFCQISLFHKSKPELRSNKWPLVCLCSIGWYRLCSGGFTQSTTWLIKLRKNNSVWLDLLSLLTKTLTTKTNPWCLNTHPRYFNSFTWTHYQPGRDSQQSSVASDYSLYSPNHPSACWEVTAQWSQQKKTVRKNQSCNPDKQDTTAPPAPKDYNNYNLLFCGELCNGITFCHNFCGSHFWLPSWFWLTPKTTICSFYSLCMGLQLYCFGSVSLLPSTWFPAAAGSCLQWNSCDKPTVHYLLSNKQQTAD